MAVRFLNLVKFPVPLEFKNATLGCRRKISIGALRGMIYLPRDNSAAIETPFSDLRPPGVRDIAYVAKVHNRGDRHDWIVWGKYFSYMQANPIATAVASVNCAIITFSQNQNGGVKTLREIAEACHRDFPIWYARLVDWIEVSTKADLDAAHPLVHIYNRPQPITTPWIFRKDGKRTYAYENPPLALVLNHGEKALDEPRWSAALRGANKQISPSEERLLLRDARAALLRGNTRRAVLDAATAAELLIESPLRRELLRTNQTPFVDHLLIKQAWQFTRRKDLMSALNLWLPPDLEKNLMKLRNKVIHENAIVSRTDATAAICVAENLADHYQPLRLP